MEKIKIGYNYFIRSKASNDLLGSLLSDSNIKWVDKNPSTINNLIDGVVDVLIMPLKWIPVEKNNEIVIAGLSDRLKANELLIISENDYTEHKVLKIPEGGTIGYQYKRQSSQLKLLRPDLKLQLMELDDSNIDLLIKKNKLSGLIIPQSEMIWKNLNIGQHRSIPLHPTELIPHPGEGVLAFITQADNLYVRRYINQIHNRETALCTNVERRLLKRFEENDRNNISAYCYLDTLGHFHATASLVKDDEEVVFSSFSQSTHLELDLRLYNLLNKKA